LAADRDYLLDQIQEGAVTSSEGLKAFAEEWNRIASELLRVDPWDFRKSAPHGPHAAIDDLELGVMFHGVARRAAKNGGAICLGDLWEEWAEAKLEVHGRTFDDLRKLGAAENTAKRIKKEIHTGVKHLAHFKLFHIEAGNNYRLTEDGRRRLQEITGADALERTKEICDVV